jgi:hypothetical protein
MTDIRRVGRLLFAITIAVGSSLFFGSAASGAETHVFDPVLSLTGGCTVSDIDPVADPSCPMATEHTFSSPRAVTVDSYGDIYVASFGNEAARGTEGRIDIFDSAGLFIGELADTRGPKNLAIDKHGNLYVFNFRSGEDEADEVVRYSPTSYEPASGEIAYGGSPTIVASPILGSLTGLAINKANDHLFIHFGSHISEYGSAAEGNPLIDDTIGAGTLFNFHGIGLTIDSARGLIYASDHRNSPNNYVVRVFELAPPHALVRTIDGSTIPPGEFLSDKLSLAVDEGDGHLFVYEGHAARVVYELTESGGYVSTIAHEFLSVFGGEIAVDNGEQSPNGQLSGAGRYLFVPSHPNGVGHVFAFGPPPDVCPPAASIHVSEVTEHDALLEAVVEPCNATTTYILQYTTQGQFEAEGFAGAETAGEGTIPAGKAPVAVSAPAVALQPEARYHVRVVAVNAQGRAEAVAEFSTYPSSALASCPNDGLRLGLSQSLPDCRAYELVTPASTNGRLPLGVNHLGAYFPTRESSPDGERVSFITEGGSIPGFPGTGSYAGDPYLSIRTNQGWATASAGPTGAEAVAALPGSTSPDQTYSLWSTAGGKGSAAIGEEPTNYVRYPDGHSALVGRGSLASDPRAIGKLISEGGSHILFVSGSSLAPAIKLEPESPPDGTAAIYDRTADEVTHVVSLLPGDDTPAPGQNAEWKGASLDGRGVAFAIGSTLYLRYDNQETYEVGNGVTFAGMAEGGARVFYLEGGDLFALDATSGMRIRFTTSGDVTPVNVSANGTAAYFVSPTDLGAGPSPSGALPQPGGENLYLSREGIISFVGTVTARDVEGDLSGNEPVEGLGLWVAVVTTGGLAGDPSRTTPDGAVLLFESRANLTDYDSEEHVQVYRYDAGEGTLRCLSCDPTGTAADGQAHLQSISQAKGAPEPLSSYGAIDNLRADGRRAFFQSTEALVAADTDGLQDIYEWEAQGVGSCDRPSGCVYLISSGNSVRVDYLYAVSDDGDDVFFRTADLLVPTDSETTPSIYDARVEGGFTDDARVPCEAEGCHLDLAMPPALPAPGGSPAGKSGNWPAHCRKGSRKVKRHGHVRCVKKHRRHHHRNPGTGRKGAGR